MVDTRRPTDLETFNSSAGTTTAKPTPNKPEPAPEPGADRAEVPDRTDRRGDVLTGCKACEMKILANVAELWVFSRAGDGLRYLVLEASQEKADAFFGGHRFWQIPGTSMNDDEPAVDMLKRGLAEFGLEAGALWAVEHVSTIFNRRFDAIQVIPAFAAEVSGFPEPKPIMSEGSSLASSIRIEYGGYEWADAQRVEQLLTFRALLESFAQLRRYITECPNPRGEFRLG